MTQATNFSDVVDFHTKFNVPVLPKLGFLSTLTDDAQSFREKFMQEELDEFKDACQKGDMVLALDSLLDLVYVTVGSAAMMGVTNEMWQELWNNVQEANMAKVRANNASESKRGSALDIVKPAGWIPPEAKHIEVIKKYS